MIKHDQNTIGLYNVKFQTIGIIQPIVYRYELNHDRQKVKGDHVVQKGTKVKGDRVAIQKRFSKILLLDFYNYNCYNIYNNN